MGRYEGERYLSFSSILFLTISGRPQPTFLTISIVFFFCNKYIFLSSMFHSVDDYDSCSELLLCICNWSWFWFVYPTFWRGYFLHHCANDIAATLWVITIFLAAKFTQKWKWKQKFTKINQQIKTSFYPAKSLDGQSFELASCKLVLSKYIFSTFVSMALLSLCDESTMSWEWYGGLGSKNLFTIRGQMSGKSFRNMWKLSTYIQYSYMQRFLWQGVQLIQKCQTRHGNLCDF